MWEQEMEELRRLSPDLGAGQPLTQAEGGEGLQPKSDSCLGVAPRRGPAGQLGCLPFPTVQSSLHGASVGPQVSTSAPLGMSSL